MKDTEDFDKRNDSVVVLSVDIRRPTSTEIVRYPFYRKNQQYTCTVL
jgi:hypothetical protein